MPPDYSAHGYEVDNLIIWTHWLMFVLFVFWSAYFLYVLYRFRASRYPKASYRGSESTGHHPRHLEGCDPQLQAAGDARGAGRHSRHGCAHSLHSGAHHQRRPMGSRLRPALRAWTLPDARAARCRFERRSWEMAGL